MSIREEIRDIIRGEMINLLPPKEKEELTWEESWKLVLILGMLSLIFLISLSLILFSIKTYISGELKSQKILVELEEKRLEVSEVKDLQKKVVALNQNLFKLDSFYQNQISLTKILEKVSETLPPGIYLTDFSFQKDISQIRISGFSPERETLFEFKRELEKEKDFREIYFPASNWVKPREIDFYLTFKLR